MMEKMKLETDNITEKNIDKIASLFPNCVTEMLDEEKALQIKKFTRKRLTLKCSVKCYRMMLWTVTSAMSLRG